MLRLYDRAQSQPSQGIAHGGADQQVIVHQLAGGIVARPVRHTPPPINKSATGQYS